MMTMKITANEKGFTMLELLVAAVILAIGILGLIGLQVAAINGNVSANEITTATTLAQDQIEQLKRLDLDDELLDDSDTGNTDTLTSTAVLEHADANNPINEQGGITGIRRYYRYWNVADDTPTENAKTVVVFVGWGAPEDGIPRHMVRVQTIIGG